MGKIWMVFSGLILTVALQAQNEMNVLGHWSDSTLVGSSFYDNTYNEIWGLAVGGHEYAIVGSTAGTHFIDVTDPSAPFEAHFVPGLQQGGAVIHRDYHDHKGYLYAVCDEGNSSLQIMDIRNLPDTVILAYDSNELIATAHNIFIDTAQSVLYAFALNGGPQRYSAMRLYDLQDPLAPEYIGEYQTFSGLRLGHVHDGYVRDGIAFLNGGNDGFAVVDFRDPYDPQTISTITDYPFAGYNHSGWLTDDARYYYMADETHGFDMKVVDMNDPCNAEVIETFNAGNNEPNSIPHNQLVACDYLYVSYYYEGLIVYDISDPSLPQKVAFYDTSTEPNQRSYKGAWGVYPYLPSGNVLVSDMQEGLFVLEGMGDNCSETQELTEVDLSCIDPSSAFSKVAVELSIYPQPASHQLTLTWPEDVVVQNISLRNLQGQILKQEKVESLRGGQLLWSVEEFPSGWYVLEVQGAEGVHFQSLVIE